jgi:uncharacterized membrane protein
MPRPNGGAFFLTSALFTGTIHLSDIAVETSQEIANSSAAGKSEPKRPSIIQRVNDRIAVFITSIVGTMWCAYVFAVMVLIPLEYPNSNTVIQYISSAFLQLILLPLIMVGQNVQGRISETRAKHDHKMIKEELKQIKDMNANLHELLTAVHARQ